MPTTDCELIYLRAQVKMWREHSEKLERQVTVLTAERDAAREECERLDREVWQLSATVSALKLKESTSEHASNQAM